jgi:hypothetical protein
VTKQSDQFLNKIEDYRLKLKPELDADLVRSLVEVQMSHSHDVAIEFEKLVMKHINGADSD